jgi:hypothetical protein
MRRREKAAGGRLVLLAIALQLAVGAASAESGSEGGS